MEDVHAFLILSRINSLSIPFTSFLAVYDSFLVLTAQDENCGNYVSFYAEKEAEKKQLKEQQKNVSGRMETEKAGGVSGGSALKKSIIRGLAKAAEDAAVESLKDSDALTVINEEMIPALDEVGKGFEAGTVFLPQLLMSAEAAKAAFKSDAEDRTYLKGVMSRKKQIVPQLTDALK